MNKREKEEGSEEGTIAKEERIIIEDTWRKVKEGKCDQEKQDKHKEIPL